MKKILFLFLFFVSFNALSQNRPPFIQITVNPRSNTEKVSTTDFNDKLSTSGQLLIVSGSFAIVGIGLSCANIKFLRTDLSYVSIGAYGLSGIFLLASGINLTLSSRATGEISFKKTKVYYGFTDSGVGFKMKM